MNGRKRVILVGAGHAHLYTLKHASAVTDRGYEFVLIAPGDFWLMCWMASKNSWSPTGSVNKEVAAV